MCGQSKAVDNSTTWSSTLKTLLNEYSPSDIVNADETGLFFRLLPDKTLEFKGVQCHGGKKKKSKERLNVMVCVNIMAGFEKIPLLVIGKQKNPRCLKTSKPCPPLMKHTKKSRLHSNI